jgi:hypothetical protein
MRIHPFTLSGHGKAPFRCIGMRENWFEMPGFGRKPGGSCDHCGTGILYEFEIVSSDGHKFVVGSTCVEKTDREYGEKTAGFREVRLQFAREKREKKASVRKAEREAAWAARQAQWAAERAAAGAIWREKNKALYDRILDEPDTEFLVSMRKTIEQWGSLTEGQQRAVERCFASKDARAASTWVGEVGKRVVLELTVERVLDWSYGSYPKIWRFCNICKDPAGNVVKYIGSNRLQNGKYKVTVKEWSEYKGCRETIVARPAEVMA